MKAIKETIRKGLNMTTDFDMKVIREYICEGCGKKVQVIRAKSLFGPNKGKYFESKKGCDCEILEKIRKQQKEAKIARINKIFEEHSLINPSLRNATFENFNPGKYFQEAYLKAKKYVEEFDINKPKNLLFQGTFGTGKSHLSVSIAKALAEKGHTTIFISTPKLLTKIRNTYNKNSEMGEEEIINMIASVNLVVFDDIGAEGMVNDYGSSSWASQKIFEIIDQRSGKHNIYTTNLSSAEFESTKDLQRIFSRMLENTELIKMDGPDYRKRQFLKEE